MGDELRKQGLEPMAADGGGTYRGRTHQEQRELDRLVYEHDMRAAFEEGRREALLELIEERFGPADAATAEEVRRALPYYISRWLQNIRTAASLADVFSDAPLTAQPEGDAGPSPATRRDREMAEERRIVRILQQVEVDVARREARAKLLVEQLRVKFGTIDYPTVERVCTAPDEALTRWSRQILSAASLAESLADD